MFDWSNIFNIYFYRELFRKADNIGYCDNNIIIDWCKRFKCRWNNHPAGIVYYNPNGYEPDYTCKNCGDEL